jgi:hypothetical protein
VSSTIVIIQIAIAVLVLALIQSRLRAYHREGHSRLQRRAAHPGVHSLEDTTHRDLHRLGGPHPVPQCLPEVTLLQPIQRPSNRHPRAIGQMQV